MIKSDFYLKTYSKKKIPKKIAIFIKNLLNMNYKKPEIDIQTKNKLINYYDNDIRNLESLIKRDLDSWLR